MNAAQILLICLAIIISMPLGYMFNSLWDKPPSNSGAEILPLVMTIIIYLVSIAGFFAALFNIVQPLL